MIFGQLGFRKYPIHFENFAMLFFMRENKGTPVL